MPYNINARDAINLLLVEDDPGHADLIKWNLEKAGIETPPWHVSNGQQALDFLLKQGEYASNTTLHLDNIIMLLDINMPVMDGYEVLEHMRSHPSIKHLPVIMLTTDDNIKDVNRCYELGCNLFLKKPINYEELMATIQPLGTLLPSLRVPFNRK